MYVSTWLLIWLYALDMYACMHVCKWINSWVGNLMLNPFPAYLLLAIVTLTKTSPCCLGRVFLWEQWTQSYDCFAREARTSADGGPIRCCCTLKPMLLGACCRAPIPWPDIVIVAILNLDFQPISAHSYCE